MLQEYIYSLLGEGNEKTIFNDNIDWSSCSCRVQ